MLPSLFSSPWVSIAIITPSSTYQISTMAPPYLDSAMELCPGIPALGSALDPPTIDSSLASAAVFSSLALPFVCAIQAPVVNPCACSASSTYAPSQFNYFIS